MNRKNPRQTVFGFADACRQAPTGRKTSFIEIAAKKQERSMLTKYKQYGDKQAKTAGKEQETGVNSKNQR